MKSGIRSNRGDTIVEVLISMTILALVLGAAYATSNRSLRAGTEAGMRSQALSYAQQQVEILKSIAVTNPEKLTEFKNEQKFCVNPTTTERVVLQNNEKCPVSGAGDIEFRVINRYDNAGSKAFIVTVEWDSATSSTAPSQVSVHYKPQSNFTDTPGSVICNPNCIDNSTTPPNQPYVTLTADPTTVLPGASTTLTWSTRFVNQCHSNPNVPPNWVGNKSPVSSGSTLVSGSVSSGAINSDTAYRIECSRNGVVTPASAQVTVGVIRITSFTSEAGRTASSPILYNSSTNLTWTSTATTRCNINGGHDRPSNGSVSTGNLTATTTYNLTCTGTGGTTPAVSTTVYVSSAPRVDYLYPNPNPINYGHGTGIYWGSSHTAGCYSPQFGWVEATGSRWTGALYGNTSYSVACYNSAGAWTPYASTTVYVNPPPPPPDCNDHTHSTGAHVSGGYASWDASIGGNNPCGIGVSQCNVFNSGGGSLGQFGASGSFYHPQAAYVGCMDIMGHWFY